MRRWFISALAQPANRRRAAPTASGRCSNDPCRTAAHLSSLVSISRAAPLPNFVGRGRDASCLAYVFSVAAGILPFSLNISHAAAAGTGRSAPVSGAAMDASEASRDSPLTPGPAEVAAAGTIILSHIFLARQRGREMALKA